MLVLCALAASSVSVPAPAAEPKQSKVVILYDSNDYVEEIEELEYNRTVIESDGVWIVEFYAPWCVERRCTGLLCKAELLLRM